MRAPRRNSGGAARAAAQVDAECRSALHCTALLSTVWVFPKFWNLKLVIDWFGAFQQAISEMCSRYGARIPVARIAVKTVTFRTEIVHWWGDGQTDAVLCSAVLLLLLRPAGHSPPLIHCHFHCFALHSFGPCARLCKYSLMYEFSIRHLDSGNTVQVHLLKCERKAVIDIALLDQQMNLLTAAFYLIWKQSWYCTVNQKKKQLRVSFLQALFV